MTEDWQIDWQIDMTLDDEPEVVYPDSRRGRAGDRRIADGARVQRSPAGARRPVRPPGRRPRGRQLLCLLQESRSSERTWLDCFVAFGVDRDAIRSRGCYYTWQTGKAPDFVLEVRTAKEIPGVGRGYARHLYSALGISEYWTFDILAAARDNRGLYGNRLVDGGYEEIALAIGADGGVRGHSPTLGIDLVQENGHLRLRDPGAGGCVLNLAEERAARLALEAENRRLRERLQRDEGAGRPSHSN